MTDTQHMNFGTGTASLNSHSCNGPNGEVVWHQGIRESCSICTAQVICNHICKDHPPLGTIP